MCWFLILTAIFNIGTKYARDFLDPGFGARALAMGSAFVAIADDASGFYWNPAGHLGVRVAGLMHGVDYNNLIQYDYLSLILGDDRSSIGLALYNLRVGGIKFTTLPDTNTQVGPENRPEITSTETALDYVLYLNRALNRNEISWGGNLKLIYRDLVVIKGYGIGCDLGLRLRKRNLMAGLALKDLVLSPIYYSSGRWEYLSPYLSFGLGLNLPFYGPGRLTPTFQFDKFFDETLYSFQGRVGIEYEFRDLVALRTGFKGTLFSLGVGFHYRQFLLDYAFLPSHPLGSCHKISGGVIF
ncbi:hypothetical protein DRP53_01625 [candidate division WOR-3 bacterium]|uniref:PorV/PorQ family protein n=1 Tax=candidate division WOR-3 bacterium TaxID=2052148 RepID=A0A660SLP6_UNCW3|nr:MAG: hypothetical protein DRP53_01625 [candidate division WOR-3 bacterium]